MRALSILVALAIAPAALAQGLTFRCLREPSDAPSCLDSGGDRSANLVVRKDVSTPVTFAWDTPSDPTAGKRVVRLFAGNPGKADALKDYGALAFAPSGTGWRAKLEIPGSELGRGTFVLVALSQGKDHEEILDWRTLRLLTSEELEGQKACATPGSAWGVTVDPTLLSVQTAHGALPRSDGEKDRVWWCFAGREDTTDLDLDGAYNGAPGLGVHVSSVWETRKEDLGDRIRDAFGGAQGHQVHFGELAWIERPDTEVELKDHRPVMLRHFYTIVTLHTAASVRAFGPEQVGSEMNFFVSLFKKKPRYFAHETSARIRHPDDPRFWASYDEREMGADPGRLRLLQRRVEQGRGIPGMPGIQTEDGDGGDTTYTVGFYVQVRPWDEPGEEVPKEKYTAGLVSADIVAARAGIGGLRTAGSGADSALERAWCQVTRCSDPGKSLDLDRPPSGYETTQPLAALGSMSGNLPLLLTEPKLAQRAVGREGRPAAVKLTVDPTDLPQKARIAITAKLRAGALLQGEGLGYVTNVVPIDSYAQFVLKLTVVQFPGATIVAANDPNAPTTNELQKETLTPEPTGILAWLKKHAFGLGILAVLAAGVGVLAIVPGGLGVLRAAAGIVTKTLRLGLDAVSNRLDRARKRQEERHEREKSGPGQAGTGGPP
jgi:hypothetical protein